MSASCYVVGRPSKSGQRLKDGTLQIDLGDLRRESLFWSKVENLVAAWCEKQFSLVYSVPVVVARSGEG